MPLTPEQWAQLQGLGARGAFNESLNFGGASNYGVLGVQNVGEGGVQNDVQGYVEFDPTKMNPGDSYWHIDSAGNRTLEGKWEDGSKMGGLEMLALALITGGVAGLYSGVLPGVTGASATIGAEGLAAAGAGAEAGGAAAAGLAGEAAGASTEAINGLTLDGAGAAPGGGGVSGASNGLWDVLPDAALPGEAGAANGMWDVLPEMGGVPGEASFQNLDPVFNAAKDSQLANQAIEAGATGFEHLGTNALANYQAAGIPSVTVNGAAPWPDGLMDGDWGPDVDGPGYDPTDMPTETDVPGIPGGGGVPGGGGMPDLPFNWNDFLSNFLDGLSALMPGGGGGEELIQPTASTPYVPPQPVVGPTDFTSAAAQGGASGSLEGVAATLLTSKNSFGYGRTMVGA